MSFGENIDNLLPNYLVQPEKARLKDALLQFTIGKAGNEIDYNDFYKNYDHLYFLQSDLVREIRVPNWDDESGTFLKRYTDAIIISNTCDINFNNKRSLNKKQCLFAPLIDIQSYIQDLLDFGYEKDKIDKFIMSIKAQLITNIFYLPNLHNDDKEYLALFDNIFWFPIDELHSYIGNIEKNRFASLSHFGYYLFILKLSYHLCRLPEQCDREVMV